MSKKKKKNPYRGTKEFKFFGRGTCSGGHSFAGKKFRKSWVKVRNIKCSFLPN
jgi:ribosomal protein L15